VGKGVRKFGEPVIPERPALPAEQPVALEDVVVEEEEYVEGPAEEHDEEGSEV
jgi:hypothetical protein